MYNSIMLDKNKHATNKLGNLTTHGRMTDFNKNLRFSLQQVMHDDKLRKHLYDAAGNGHKAYVHVKRNNMSLKSLSDRKTRKHMAAVSDALHQAKARTERSRNRKKKLLTILAASVAIFGIGRLSSRHHQAQKNYGPPLPKN